MTWLRTWFARWRSAASGASTPVVIQIPESLPPGTYLFLYRVGTLSESWLRVFLAEMTKREIRMIAVKVHGDPQRDVRLVRVPDAYGAVDGSTR